MIQEYLVNDKNINSINDYSSDEINQTVSKINDLQILTISMDGKNETNAKIMSEIHEEIISENVLTVLNNGCSEYFNKSLFPLINEFERKLRKLLYLAVVIIPSGEIKDVVKIKDLENKNLGDIFETLFTDRKFNSLARKTVNTDWQYDKKTILDNINNIEENTLWYQLLSDDVMDLSNNYIFIKNARNDVMHARDINYSRFLKIRRMYKTINKEIDSSILEFRNPKDKNLQEMKYFNILLSEAMSNQAKIAEETMGFMIKQFEKIKLLELNSEFTSLITMLSKFFEKCALDVSDKQENKIESPNEKKNQDD